MSEQIFYDAEKHPVVRLGNDHLVYAPRDRRGWQCELQQIRWTTSKRTFWGIEEVRVHARDGKSVAVISEFSTLADAYTAILNRLLSHRFFDAVRSSFPEEPAHLEQILWVASQMASQDGAWEGLEYSDGALALATTAGIVLMPSEERKLHRINWSELAGIRYRAASGWLEEDATRFFTASEYVDVPIAGLNQDFVRSWERHWEQIEESGGEIASFTIEGLDTLDEDLAQSFSWELEWAKEHRLIEDGETVCACAVGKSQGSLPNAIDQAAEGFFTAGKVGAIVGIGKALLDSQIRTALFLTDERLLQVDSNTFTDGIARTLSTELADLPRLRAGANRLTIGSFELRTDENQPFDMAAEFVERYRRMLELLASDDAAAEPLQSNSTAPATDKSVAERLRELHSLFEAGILTADEYSHKKAVLVDLL